MTTTERVATTTMSVSGLTEARACANCREPLTDVFVDLGVQPPCQAFVPDSRADEMEPFYPLTAYVCRACFLVQVPSRLSPDDIFTDYAYFSSYSDSWLDHARRYVDMVTERFALNAESFVLEVASNDGYLLRNFVERGIPCLGVEPALNVAEVARRVGIPTLSEFFGVATARQLANEGAWADLVIGNNVLAQCPDVHDFVGGIAEILKPEGVLTLEFPHLARLIEERQFDTIYHEHFFYFSLLTTRTILAGHGLRVFDVERLSTHGGSLRLYVSRDTSQAHRVSDRVEALLREERDFGLDTPARYAGFQEQVASLKRSVLTFLITAHAEGKHVAAYGAPGKGNTLLNFCGIRTDFVEYAVDRAPSKQGHSTPGTRIPVYPPEHLRETQPDYVVIMPWNLKDEIAEQHQYIEEWGGQFVIFLPDVQVLRDGTWTPL